jgi:hypothetical protein
MRFAVCWNQKAHSVAKDLAQVLRVAVLANPGSTYTVLLRDQIGDDCDWVKIRLQMMGMLVTDAVLLIWTNRWE